MEMPKLGTESIIDDSILRNSKREPRDYLGFSQIGEECERKLFYDLNCKKKEVTDPRMIRLFKLGDIMETEIISLLRQAGLTIYDKDDEGKQFRVSYFSGKYSGAPDGIITGLKESSVPHVLEIKTYNDDRFKKLKKEGVKSSDPKYYSQMQANMGAFELTRSFFVAYNKNTSEMYYERIDYDPFDAALLMAKAKRVIDAKSADEFDRPYPDKNFFKCKFCDHREFCWENNKE